MFEVWLLQILCKTLWSDSVYNRILQTLSFPQRSPAHNQYDEKELSNCYITTMIMMQLKCNGDGDDGGGNFGDNYIGEGLRRSGSEHVH